MSNKTPRVRFAPSPTGYLHVGGLRTALYNYLFAKKNGGEFILRIEDTDQNRFVEGAVESLIDAINWVGLEYDEGPNKEGNVGPYFQSERLDIYKKYSNQLIEQGDAYRCFCTPERLTALREEQQKAKLPQAKYDKLCLHLSKEEIEKNLAEGKSHIVRLNVKAGENVVINDIVRDKVEFTRDVIDDQVLIKTDGFPTYHLANVVDDHLMGITHVIRGEEWLSSTPKHILLYNAFGWELPIFAHLPLLLNADRSKLSKRQGDVAVEDYKAKGYLKEALLNFVALLGWSTSENDEFFNLDDLIEKFSLERVHKAGAIFNVEKLDWINAEHLRKKDKSDILQMLKAELAESKYKDLELSDEYLLLIVEAMLERVSFVKEYVDNSPYFYESPTTYDEAVIKKRWKDDSVDLLQKYIAKLSELENPVKADYEIVLKQVAEEAECGAGRIIHPARIATSGVGIGPGVYDLLFILGKDEVISRINDALKVIPELSVKNKLKNYLEQMISKNKNSLMTLPSTNSGKESVKELFCFNNWTNNFSDASWNNINIVIKITSDIVLNISSHLDIVNTADNASVYLFFLKREKIINEIICVDAKEINKYLNIDNSISNAVHTLNTGLSKKPTIKIHLSHSDIDELKIFSISI